MSSGEFVRRSERHKPEVTKYTNLYVKNFPKEWDEEIQRVEPILLHQTLLKHPYNPLKIPDRWAFIGCFRV